MYIFGILQDFNLTNALLLSAIDEIKLWNSILKVIPKQMENQFSFAAVAIFNFVIV